MIHAFYCYDSDPHDRWFTEDVELVDAMYWHLEKYFPPDSMYLLEQLTWVQTKHFGGYEFTLGGQLNQPVRSIFNEPAIWIPTSMLKLTDELVILLNGTEVYRG